MPFMALRRVGHADLERVLSASAGRGRSDHVNRILPSKHRSSLDYIPTVSCSSPCPLLYCHLRAMPERLTSS